MAFLGKVYKFDRQENFDGFLKAAGLPESEIAKLMEFKPTTKLIKDGDSYTYVNITPQGTKETTFKSGVEFDDKIQDKIPIKTTYTVAGNLVTQVIKNEKGSATIKREYKDDEMIASITASIFDGEAKRWYKA